VSKSKVVIFGGATGDTGKYIITGDTYALDLISSKWSKLEGKQSRWSIHHTLAVHARLSSNCSLTYCALLHH